MIGGPSISLIPLTYQLRPQRPYTYSNVITMGMNIVLEHGYPAAAGYLFETYAICLAIAERYREAYEFGKLGMALNEHMGNFAMKGRTTTFFCCYIHFWREPFHACESSWQAAYEQLRESGDHIHANFLAIDKGPIRIAQSLALSRVGSEMDDDLAWIKPMGYDPCHRTVAMERRLVANLMGQTPRRLSLNGDGFDEETFLTDLAYFPVGLAHFYAAKQMVAFLYREPLAAIEAAECYQPHAPAVSGMAVTAEHSFFYALALFAAMDDMSEDEQTRSRQVLAQLLTQAQHWADNCRENFENRHLLLQAEMARIDGRYYEAMELYDQAISSAQKNGLVNNVALASEAAGRFYRSRGREKLAREYLGDAWSSYRNWGAEGKVDHLEQEFGEWLTERTTRRASTSLDTSTAGAAIAQLDMMSIINASRVLSSVLVKNTLIDKIMEEILKNAGAERGCLLQHDSAGAAMIVALGEVQDKNINVSRPDDPYELDAFVCRQVVEDAQRTGQDIVLDDGEHDATYGRCAYMRDRQIRSLLCIPARRKDKIVAVLYLENNLTASAFTPDRVDLLRLLVVQVAISLENAVLYDDLHSLNADLNALNTNLEQIVEERTAELRAAQEELQSRAHKTGMAEVASEVLHNVGNILNSVTTSLSVLERVSAKASYRKLNQANELLHSNRDRLPQFLTQDRKGAVLVEYYSKVGTVLSKEAERFGDELGNLRECVSLIQDVLRVQREHADTTWLEEVVDLNDLVGKFLTLQRATMAEEGIQLEENLGPSVRVYVQRTRLMHVLTNLFRNAIDAMAECSDKVLTIGTAQVGEMAYIHFGDNGCGIAPAIRQQIFTPGFTTKASGTGLGLHSSINAVRAMHGGDLVATSEGLGRGATFTLSFPVYTAGDQRGHREHERHR